MTLHTVTNSPCLCLNHPSGTKRTHHCSCCVQEDSTLKYVKQYMDGNKHRSLGWNWWQCKLWCSANDASSKKKHSQSEPLASALCTTPLTSSPCLFFKIKDWGWSGSWESGGPCCFTSGHNRSVVHSRSHVRALQGYKRWTRWRNCKGNPPHPVIWLANLMQDFFYWSMFESITLMRKVFILICILYL